MDDVKRDDFHRRIGTGGADLPLEIVTRGRKRFEVRADEPAIEGAGVSATPSAPVVVGAGVLFFRDRGDGKSQLCVRFPSGATQILSTES